MRKDRSYCNKAQVPNDIFSPLDTYTEYTKCSA